MVKKGIAVLLLICLVGPLFSLDMGKAVPYDDSEFPKWSLDLRRGEILFFGSLPITFAMTSLAAGALNSNMEFWPKVGIACGISTVIVLIDYFIGLDSR